MDGLEVRADRRHRATVACTEDGGGVRVTFVPVPPARKACPECGAVVARSTTY